VAAFHLGGLESLLCDFYIHGVEEATKHEDLLAKKGLFFSLSSDFPTFCAISDFMDDVNLILRGDPPDTFQGDLMDGFTFCLAGHVRRL
jgi:hypothetical protein